MSNVIFLIRDIQIIHNRNSKNNAMNLLSFPLFLLNVQDTLNVLKERSEVGTSDSSLVEKSQQAQESSEVPIR